MVVVCFYSRDSRGVCVGPLPGCHLVHMCVSIYHVLITDVLYIF